MTTQTVDLKNLSSDSQAIFELIEPNSKVLDLGCGDGELLYHLIQKKGCRASGIEIDEHSIYQCIEKGITVSHADINEEMAHYPDKRFDYVILNESLQQVVNAEKVITEALRIGKQIIVGVPNFCFLPARLQIFFGGSVPKTKCLPYEWYNTPNVRFFSLKDFRTFCKKKNIKIKDFIGIGNSKRVVLFPNLFAILGIFLLEN